MKKQSYIFILFLFCGMLTSCEDEDKIYHPDTEDVPQIFPRIDQENNFYNLNDLASNPAYSFRVELDARGVDVASVEVYKTLDAAVVFTPRMLVTTLTSFPAEVTIPINEAISGIEITEEDGTTRPLAITDLGASPDYEDTFIYTFEIVRADGRRIVYTPVDEDGYLRGLSQIFEPYAAWAPVREP